MILPILSKLKDGIRFDSSTLMDNIEQTAEFWEWWWETQCKPGKLMRPEIMKDGDELLELTIGKKFVDTICHRELMDNAILCLLNPGIIPSSPSLDRELFRSLAMKAVAQATVSGPQPWIVFTGGGYGSGKTTALQYVGESGELPCQALVGADMFKQLIPEFNSIKGLADGRASLTVQDECMLLLKRLFPLLVEKRRSFVLDSSMSDRKETLARIELAKAAGYQLMVVAVLAPLQLAIDQAMHRARISRRFPHPKALPESHVSFRQHLMEYLPLFDRALVYTNSGNGASLIKVAEKKLGMELAVEHPQLLKSALDLQAGTDIAG